MNTLNLNRDFIDLREFSNEDRQLMQEYYEVIKARNIVMPIYEKELKSLAESRATRIEDAVLRFHESYDLVYGKIFPCFIGTPIKPAGTLTGDWGEDSQAFLVRSALPPTYSVLRTKSKKLPDTIVLDGEHKKAGVESKLQSDYTSFKNAIEHADETLNHHGYEKSIFLIPTNGFCGKDNKKLLALLKKYHATDAETLISDIKTRQAGWFTVNDKIGIGILGFNIPEYTAWKGNAYKNHGGTAGWTLSDSAVQEILENIKLFVQQ